MGWRCLLKVWSSQNLVRVLLTKIHRRRRSRLSDFRPEEGLWLERGVLLSVGIHRSCHVQEIGLTGSCLVRDDLLLNLYCCACWYRSSE